MTEETRVVSSTGGEKGQKLARYDLIPVRALEQVATLYGIGAQKYEERNWEKGYPWSLSYAAMQRHANAHWGGEEIDPETGIPHMASVVFHALAQLDFMLDHREFDDRPSTLQNAVEDKDRDRFYNRTIELLTEKQPRVWDRIQDVPTDVRVVNRDDEVMYYANGNYGEYWYEYKHGENDPSYYEGNDYTNELFGPFTEVLEAE